MNEIVKVITVQFSEEEINAVDARELWKFLEVGTAFSDWIKKRIVDYEFVNNSDYLILSDPNYRGIGNAPVEYTISLDMAKELSMVERNEKGREARKYFIECEKILNQKEVHVIPKTLSEALQLAANQAKLIELQTEELEQAQPKVDFVDNYVDCSGLFTLTAVAKNLNFKRTDLIKCLERDKVLFRRGGKLEPYVTQVQAERFVLKTGKGEFGHAYNQTYMTAKGVNWVLDRYASELGE